MKRIINLLLTIALCVFLGGCSENKIAENHISKIGTENNGEYVVELMQLDRDYMDRLLCIHNDNIVYSNSDSQSSVRTFYRYNMEEDRTYKIGDMEYPRVSSGDIVAIGDKIYFYYETVVLNSNKTDGEAESALYQIDLAADTLQKVASVDVDQTLIYLAAAGGRVFSYKGKINGDEGITYLDVLDASDENNIKFDTLLYKVYQREKMCGELIYHFSIYDSSIYTIVKASNAADDVSWTIEKYDLEGNYVDSWHIDDTIVDWLKSGWLVKFEIFGKYGFMETARGGVLFRISSDGIIPEILRDMEWDGDFDIAMPADNIISNYVVLYSRDTGEIWRLDLANDSLHKLDLPYTSLNYIYMSNDNKILISSDTVVYGEIAQFPIEDENLLAH